MDRVDLNLPAAHFSWLFSGAPLPSSLAGSRHSWPLLSIQRNVRAIPAVDHCYSQVTAPGGSAVAMTRVRADRTGQGISAMAAPQNAVDIAYGPALRASIAPIHRAGTEMGTGQ